MESLIRKSSVLPMGGYPQRDNFSERNCDKAFVCERHFPVINVASWEIRCTAINGSFDKWGKFQQRLIAREYPISDISPDLVVC